MRSIRSSAVGAWERGVNTSPGCAVRTATVKRRSWQMVEKLSRSKHVREAFLPEKSHLLWLNVQKSSSRPILYEGPHFQREKSFYETSNSTSRVNDLSPGL